MLLLTILSLILPALGDESETLKVMFFGDDVVAGVHNADIDICPFRYEFLHRAMKQRKEVVVVGTNSDPESTCQKLGEGLDPHNNGYRNAGTYELLDYIAADLRYLHKPVDYIFTSIGTKDCLEFPEGGDFQIVSQSIRRVMGRLLNINEQAKIIHLPILIPESAGVNPVNCMKFVNAKLREVYDFDKEHDHITVVKLQNEVYDSDSFFKIGKEKPKVSEPTAVVHPVATATVESEPVEVVPKTPVVAETPKASVVAETPQLTIAAVEQETGKPESSLSTPTTSLPGEPEKSPSKDDSVPNVRRIDDIPLMFLPKKKLIVEIAKALIDTVDFGFRAQTLHPTMEVTKEPDYYGYDWCTNNYEEDECFEYYYGYNWCTENYGDDECYNYYYGDIEEWSGDDSYKWCLNLYDEEYCSFAYLGQEPDTWDWLSFGYQDCLKSYDAGECFDQYYGYAWCLNEYEEEECYEYYYGGEEWVWDDENSYKWCINFYSDEECSHKYLASSLGEELERGNVSTLLPVVAFVATFTGLLWVAWKKFACFKTCRKKSYSRLDSRDVGGEDEVELL